MITRWLPGMYIETVHEPAIPSGIEKFIFITQGSSSTLYDLISYRIHTMAPELMTREQLSVFNTWVDLYEVTFKRIGESIYVSRKARPLQDVSVGEGDDGGASGEGEPCS